MIETLQAEIDEFCRLRDWDRHHSPRNLATALSVEASELLELYQWMDTSGRNGPERERIAEELGDVLIYALRFARIHGFDIPEIVRAKMVKNAERYPEVIR